MQTSLPPGCLLEAATAELVEVLWVVAALEGELVGDATRLYEVAERLVHRLHAVLPAGLHRRIDHVGLPLTDEVPDRRRRDEDLARHRTAGSVGGREQLLRHDPHDRGRQLHADLLLLVRR